MDITNLYLPPRAENPELSWIPASQRCVIAEDLNGHSLLWDAQQPEDAQGELVTDFITDKDLICANSGSPTRVNRGTGGLSTPDITLTSKCFNNKVSWTTDDCLGSDHLPVITELQEAPTRTDQA